MSIRGSAPSSLRFGEFVRARNDGPEARPDIGQREPRREAVRSAAE
jgi:hypothetical protein